MTNRAILVVNGGSSSLKCSLFALAPDEPERFLDFRISNVTGEPYCHIVDANAAELANEMVQIDDEPDRHVSCLQHVIGRIRQLDDVPEIVAVGHRVVHGGDQFTKSLMVDADTLHKLHDLSPLAPLHQPVNLKLIEACATEFPSVRQVACFDTAFHQRIPDVARSYALPEALKNAGVRAYGFHGISYEYVWNRLKILDQRAKEKRIIIAHFGAGSSLCAIKGGHSIATTMGYSTADGMPMATRSGSVDPGVLIHLLREQGMTPDELEDLIYKKSGLLAISGISGNMLELHESTDPRARAAIDYFVYRAVREIGSLVGALGGLDTLVFTGGIGENDSYIRSGIAGAFQWLGFDLDKRANAEGESMISTPRSTVSVHVIPTDEEAQIALHTKHLLQNSD